VSRPRSDRLQLVERAAEVLRADPTLSANAVHHLIGGRRRDVLRVVRAIRTVTPDRDVSRPPSRFPNDEAGS
jgi:hypothetical protein